MSSKTIRKKQNFKEFLEETYIHYNFDDSMPMEYTDFHWTGTMQEFLDEVFEGEKGLFYQMFHYGLSEVEMYVGMGSSKSRITRISESEYERLLKEMMVWLS
jgi:hypothetical protein